MPLRWSKIGNIKGFMLLRTLNILKLKLNGLSKSRISSKKLLGKKRKISTFAVSNGFVAQLNRAPDYGSGGFRFES